MRWKNVQTWSVARRVGAGLSLVLLSAGIAWAVGLKITERPVADPLDGTEIVGIIQGGVDKQITAADIGALGGSAQGLGPNFALTDGELITGATEAKPLKIRGSGGQATSGWNIYMHSSGTPTMRCVIADVEGACDSVVALSSGKKFQVKNNGGTVILEVDEATGTVTKLTMDGETSGVSFTLYQRICGGDLVGIDPATGTASHIWNKDGVSGALVPTATAQDGTNRARGVATFPDSDGEYGLQLTCELPAFTGNVDVVIWWDTTGTGNARFQMASKCYADDEADDASFNTASVVTAAAGTSGRPNRQVLSNLTMTGCAANELARFRFFRQRTEGSDTLNAALNVERVEVWSRVVY